jgi:hypothetical protein
MRRARTALLTICNGGRNGLDLQNLRRLKTAGALLNLSRTEDRKEVKLLLIASLFIVGIYLLKKIPRRSRDRPAIAQTGFGISMTKAEIAAEEKYDEKILKLVEDRLMASGYLHEEKIPELMSTLREATVAFGRNGVDSAFVGDSYLTLEQKRALGLNPRMKYSHKYIGYFKSESFKDIEPKGFLGTIRLDSFHRISREKKLFRMKVEAGIKRVRLIPDHECPTAMALRRTYSIDQVPELPAPGCRLEFCRCYFEAIIPTQ